MGKIGASCAGRLGKSLLELGGNNAIIVTPDADIKMTVIGAVFGAVEPLDNVVPDTSINYS
jgi:aldehyde dehydrogenase (NAD+)